MTPFFSLGQSIWGILLGVLWLLIGVLHLGSLWTGHIIGVSGGKRAIRRAEQPTRFWITWFALAWPFVFLPLFVAVGLMLQMFGNA